MKSEAGEQWTSVASMTSFSAGAALAAFGAWLTSRTGYYGGLLVALGGLWMVGATALAFGRRAFGLVSCSLCSLPPVALFGAQFARRCYYWVRHGGEASDGTGSPALFLFGWAHETPFTLFFAWVAITLAVAWALPEDVEDRRRSRGRARHRGASLPTRELGGCE